ncbi:mycofactocin biosynthesis peptidyl-dipeptidase MftE [Tsukamurella sp. 8F]|uniref:mycofactocin biosynthesis peptidyl-dipeptidase MftE n=1 Tax=unclassified Tsukamurella TaxID=2633480 RepID=UPI0023BA2882|nr:MULTISPECIES: mycofactocin biosynthesis peptidyl-dipeptidase MftE [unclassified Tsukamurella]MDF0530176.1 mycofactocin biosynthesis peptidyl-dipeptidase MftE [Tsukamurella sp. 8J]MDF0586493.1 mycofactocin biosynthesis peptidyl-dipeptidase MftE [Tsukamurella sp. 8F]
MTDALGPRTWPEIEGGAPRLVVVPLGALEQHGPHLPLDTDTRIAEAVARAVAAAVDGACAPAVAYGASGEHEGFPGTVSLGTEALKTLLIEYGRSVCVWAPRLLIVNGHGGNVAGVAAAVTQLRYERRDVAWLPCDPMGSDPHAGRTETSLLLHLAPDTVRTKLIHAGDTRSLTELLPEIRAGGVRAVSSSGVLGDPRGATAAEGERLLVELTGRAADSVRRWAPDDAGRLR